MGVLEDPLKNLLKGILEGILKSLLCRLSQVIFHTPGGEINKDRESWKWSSPRLGASISNILEAKDPTVAIGSQHPLG